jgi:hypothetical protein
MKKIEIDFSTYLPDVRSYIYMYSILSKEFNINHNFLFYYNTKREGKKMLAHIYCGDVNIINITGLSDKKILELVKFPEVKNLFNDYVL